MCLTSAKVQEDDDNILKYQQFGSRAAHLGVFHYLYQMIRHPMYGDRFSVIGRIVRMIVYNLLNELCDLFDNDGSMARHKSIFQLFSELLKTYSIAEDFIGRDGESLDCFFFGLIEIISSVFFSCRWMRFLVQHCL